MRILHVTIGDPEQRQGGLNRYCLELMRAQEELKHIVGVIYPGNIGLCFNPRIVETGKHKYRINNALPVAITYGITDTEKYMKGVDDSNYVVFLKLFGPDIIHVHSIQGIHKEFFVAAKRMGIKIVFTTHDYFPICFKSTLFDSNKMYCDRCDMRKCAECNYGCGLSLSKQIFIQSSMYSAISKNKIVKSLKTKLLYGKKKAPEIAETKDVYIDKNKEKDYLKLHLYYSEILECFDIIHCNSEVSYEIYSKQVARNKCILLPILHEGLVKSRHTMKSNHFHIAFMGGTSEHKGYIYFEELLNHLNCEEIDNWHAYFYGSEFREQNTDKKSYVGFFKKEESESIWSNTDILIVPSQWPETFGFVVLEALCHGIPVVASSIVGSGGILQKIDENLIFKYNEMESLCNIVKKLLNKDYYETICNKINDSSFNISMKKHVNDLITKCY